MWSLPVLLKEEAQGSSDQAEGVGRSHAGLLIEVARWYYQAAGVGRSHAGLVIEVARWYYQAAGVGRSQTGLLKKNISSFYIIKL